MKNIKIIDFNINIIIYFMNYITNKIKIYLKYY